MTSQHTVLLVEDDPDIRGAICELLQFEGYEVAMAANGSEALRVLARLEPRPSLILLDLMMPVLDGYGFLERLRAHATLPAIPVLVLTASPIDRAPEGTVGLLRKPMDVDTLLAQVTRHCPPGDEVSSGRK
jgi:CheY-like chemotaxis protein